MERQLGQYKKYVRNTRYPEGCIAEQYVAHECVMYCKLYMGEIEDGTSDQEEEEPWDISVTSHVIKPMGYIRRMKLRKDEIDVTHCRGSENYCKQLHILASDNWKVVDVVAQRGTYSDSCLSEDGSSNVVEKAYQEDETTNIPHFHMSNEYDEDDDIDEGLETPRTVPALYYDYAVPTGGDAMDVEENEDEFVEEDEEDDDDELEYLSDNYESDDGVDGKEDGDEQEDD
ncbi:hypothetical protein QQ045_009963 [Rhodiola kirilowii]